MEKVVEVSSAPDGDYLEPPEHVSTEIERRQWLKIMVESQCPYIRLPVCSARTIDAALESGTVGDYAVYRIGQEELGDGGSSYCLVKEIA